MYSDRFVCFFLSFLRPLLYSFFVLSFLSLFAWGFLDCFSLPHISFPHLTSLQRSPKRSQKMIDPSGSLQPLASHIKTFNSYINHRRNISQTTFCMRAALNEFPSYYVITISQFPHLLSLFQTTLKVKGLLVIYR